MRANRISGLGDDTSDDASLGPLPTLDVPSFSVDPNLVIAGVGILGLALLLKFTGGKYTTYSRRRKTRARRKRELKEELRRL